MPSTGDFVGAAPPPPGVTPSPTNPESIAWQLILASCLGPVLTIPIVAVRFYTAARILKRYHLDDCEFYIAKENQDISRTNHNMSTQT